MRSLKLIMMMSLVCLVLFSCRKETLPVDPVAIMQLQVFSSNITLSQSNAAGAAIHFKWTAFANEPEAGVSYTIEACTPGSQFNNAVEIGNTNQLSLAFTVQEFNQQVRKLIMANTREPIEFRVRANTLQTAPRYSNVVVVIVTAYQPYALYEEDQIMRLPGNYEDWIIPCAPRIISAKRNGEYEGFVNFTHPNSQFYLVKGTQWDNVTTYNQTGPGKFGFNGGFFIVPGGSGINKVTVSMNTYTWSCTKINSFGLYGSAVSADNKDAEMIFDASTLSWRITKDLLKGDIVFRADRSNTIVFGHNEKSAVGVADANGEKISIPKAGNYTIVLSLESAGNYSYGMRKNT